MLVPIPAQWILWLWSYVSFFLVSGFPLGGPGSLYGDYSPSHVSHSGRSMFGDIPPTPGSGSITLPGSLESKFGPNIITKTEKDCIFMWMCIEKYQCPYQNHPPTSQSFKFPRNSPSQLYHTSVFHHCWVLKKLLNHRSCSKTHEQKKVKKKLLEAYNKFHKFMVSKLLLSKMAACFAKKKVCHKNQPNQIIRSHSLKERTYYSPETSGKEKWPQKTDINTSMSSMSIKVLPLWFFTAGGLSLSLHWETFGNMLRQPRVETKANLIYVTARCVFYLVEEK